MITGTYERQYGRDDINYRTWYSDWAKLLAQTYTRPEIETRLGVTQCDLSKAAKVHHRAVSKSTSMTSNSQHRAQSRNVVAATGDLARALRGALEMHDLFPEYAKEAARK